MLTLNETTLYYHSLNRPLTHKAGVIKKWAAKADIFSAPLPMPVKSKSVDSHSQSRAPPSLSHGSTHSSSKSVLSNAISIITNSDPNPSAVLNDDDLQGGFVDEDETKGVKRDAAASSPLKGKVCATNKVSHGAPAPADLSADTS